MQFGAGFHRVRHGLEFVEAETSYDGLDVGALAQGDVPQGMLRRWYNRRHGRQR